MNRKISSTRTTSIQSNKTYNESILEKNQKKSKQRGDVTWNLFRSEMENAFGGLPLGEDGVGHGEVAGAPTTCIGEGGG